jgi:hypothetical protein
MSDQNQSQEKSNLNSEVELLEALWKAQRERILRINGDEVYGGGHFIQDMDTMVFAAGRLNGVTFKRFMIVLTASLLTLDTDNLCTSIKLMQIFTKLMMEKVSGADITIIRKEVSAETAREVFVGDNTIN